MDGVPTVVLEVGVFNESEEELLAEGSEWLDLPTTQVRHNRAVYALWANDTSFGSQCTFLWLSSHITNISGEIWAGEVVGCCHTAIASLRNVCSRVCCNAMRHV